MHFIWPVSHQLSTGLLKKVVQWIIFYLRGRYLKQDLTKTWLMDIEKKIIFGKTKSQKIYDYISTKLILDLNP